MGVTVVKGSVAGAGAVVTRSMPSDSGVGGNPTQVTCTVEELVGKRRQLAHAHPEYSFANCEPEQ
jgi:acetyltransferase-like isoleucine patch superfamily enzyme